MRLSLLRAATIAALSSVVVSPAFAHGGAYQGPRGEVPPNSREPHDPPPPGDGPGPGTPGGTDGNGPFTPGGGDIGSPGTPDGGTGGPGTGGNPNGGPVGGNGGRTGGPTTSRRGAKSLGLDDWQFWWNQNSAEFVSVRAAARAAVSGSGATAIGRGVSAGRVVRVTDAVVRAEVIPLLRSVLARADEDPDVRAAAVIALAKIGDAGSIPEVARLAREQADGRLVAESSALALGLFEMADVEIRESLADLVRDRTRTTSFARPFAAIGLGLVPTGEGDRPAVRDALFAVLAGREAGTDAKPAALLGLGALADPATVPDLLAALRTGRLPREGAASFSELELAYVAQALGRIGAPGSGPLAPTEVVDAMTEILGRDADSPHVRRSAAVALGRLGQECRDRTLTRVLDVLVREVERGDDAQTRHFALISLGRIGGARQTPEAARRRCVEVLRKTLDSGRPANLVQPYAALALGLVARGSETAGHGADEEGIRRPVREKLEETREPSVRAAYAVAAGLCRDSRATDTLLAIAGDKSSGSRLRGYAALALGLVRDARAVDPVRAMIAEDGDRELRLLATTSAGLLGDPRVVTDLVTSLGDPDASQYTLGSAAVALGSIGDERAVGPLCEIVSARAKFPDLTRALAVVALGRIGDRREIPTLARLAADVNYRAQVPAVAELLTIL